MATEGTGKNAARELGQTWKVSPSVGIKAGTTFTMAEIEGPGARADPRGRCKGLRSDRRLRRLQVDRGMVPVEGV